MSVPFEAAIGELVRLGFARDAAEREVTRQLGGGRVGSKTAKVVHAVIETHAPEARASYPLRLTLPWSALESDNRKYGATIRNVGPRQTPTALLVMQPGYRLAKEKARAIARAAMLGNPVSIPLQLVARVWLPDNRPGHDVANFAKCAHDALEKVVYTSDQWLHDVRWIRAGVDVDHPRAEITITPLTNADA